MINQFLHNYISKQKIISCSCSFVQKCNALLQYFRKCNMHGCGFQNDDRSKEIQFIHNMEHLSSGEVSTDGCKIILGSDVSAHGKFVLVFYFLFDLLIAFLI